MSSQFDARLESLRGVAAMAVLFAHASAVFQIDGSPAFWSVPFFEQTRAQMAISAFSAFFNPSAAVVLFFVLSGYVLTLSLQKQHMDATGMLAYGVRRAFRLLPPMWVSILLCYAIVRPVDGVHFSAWYRSVFAGDAGLRSLAANLLLVDFKVNPVTWTMFVEVIGSMYVLGLTFFRRSLQVDPIVVLLLAALTAFAYPSLALSYLLAFHMGGLMTKVQYPVIAPRSVAALAIFLFVLERLFYSSRPGSAILLTAASALLIVAVRGGAFQKLLLSLPLRFVGKVSYSLYLLHILVLYAAGIVFSKLGFTGVVGFGLVLITSVPLSLLLAWVSFAVIERWSMEAGRRISKRLSPNRRAAGS